MPEAPPPLKRVAAGLALVGLGVPILWLLLFWTQLGVLANVGEQVRLHILGAGAEAGDALAVAERSFFQSWAWDVVVFLWPAVLVMQIAGQILCLRVPREWPVGRAEIVAIALNVVHLALILVVFLDLWPALGQSQVLARAVGLTLWGLILVVPALHLIFMTNFTPQIGQEELSLRAERLIFYLFLIPFFPLVIGLSAWLFPGAQALYPVVILGALALLVELLMLVRFTNLHLAAYHGIDRYRETFAEKAKLEKAGWVDEPGR